MNSEKSKQADMSGQQPTATAEEVEQALSRIDWPAFLNEVAAETAKQAALYELARAKSVAKARCP